MSGQMKLKKKWMPKLGEKFWELQFDEGAIERSYQIKVNQEEWGDYMVANFNCFSTKSKAVEAKRAILKVLGGK